MTSRKIPFICDAMPTASMSFAFLLALLTVFCQRATVPVHDILIAGGEVYDGIGGPPSKADVAVLGDKVVKIGQVDRSQARRITDGVVGSVEAAMNRRAAVRTTTVTRRHREKQRGALQSCVFAFTVRGIEG